MTAIQGFIGATRRPGELGIHSLDHFNFVVPDLAVAQNFFGEFGLDVGAKETYCRSTRSAILTLGERSAKDRARSSAICRSEHSRTISTGSRSICRLAE